MLVRPGLRLISVNTNLSNNFNFWLLLGLADPANHLRWLYDTLHAAEANREAVYIIGHIPPGTKSCLGRMHHSVF